jgi:hypothetical protein
MYRQYQNRAKRCALTCFIGRTLTARYARRKRFVPARPRHVPALRCYLPITNGRMALAKSSSVVRMLDQRDHGIRPALGVVDVEIVAVDSQKMPQGLKSRTLVALLEGMGSRSAGHKHHAEYEDVLLTEAEEISRAPQRTFEQSVIPHKIPLSRCFHLEAVCSMTASIGSQFGSFGKGGSDVRKPLHEFATQCRVVDLTLYWAGMQNYIGRPPRRSQSQQFDAEIAIEREPTLGNFHAFLARLSYLRGHVVTRSCEFLLKRINLRIKLFCCGASPFADR